MKWFYHGHRSCFAVLNHSSRGWVASTIWESGRSANFGCGNLTSCYRQNTCDSDEVDGGNDVYALCGGLECVDEEGEQREGQDPA